MNKHRVLFIPLLGLLSACGGGGGGGSSDGMSTDVSASLTLGVGDAPVDGAATVAITANTTATLNFGP